MKENNIKRFISITSFLIFLVVVGIGSKTYSKNQEKSYSIGILLPMEHTALTDMVGGFRTSLQKAYPYPVVIQQQNAQGDIKLQRSILERFKGQKVDIVVTIGTSTAQMALSIFDQTPLISLAALLPEQEVLQKTNLTGVIDEVGGEKKMNFLKTVFPQLKKMTVLFHSGNEKNYPEVNVIKQIGKQKGIEVQAISVQTLPELQMAASSISTDSELILILKDHLMASGITLIRPIAESRKIPLVASDEGSVKGGASFALGVSEQKIGEAGGVLAAKILSGTAVKDLPMQSLQTLIVFYNLQAAERQGVSIIKLEQAAKAQKYTIEQVLN